MKKVLICDDDEGIVDVMKIILENKGYKVKVCANESLIFKIISKEKPDVLLLDLWMPHLSGEEITKRLKKNDATKSIKVIIISAHRFAAKIAKEIKADDYLLKPFDIYDLEKKVKKYAPLP